MTYEQENSFAGYDPSGLTPQDLLARLVALQSKISSTISEVRREDGKLTQKQSELKQGLDEISLEVFSIDSQTGEKRSRFSIMDGVISSMVSYEDYTGEVIASLIEQSATAIDIISRNINLVGAVTVLSDITGNLGNITAGTISIDTVLTVGDTLNIGTQQDLSTDTWTINLGWLSSIKSEMISSGDALVSYNSTSHTFNGSVTFNNDVSFNGSVDVGTVDNATYASSAGYADSAGSASYASSSGSAGTLGGYGYGDFAKNYLGSQDISFEVNSGGSLIVRVNGKTAMFTPNTWTG